MKQILLMRAFSHAALPFLPQGTGVTTAGNLHTMAAATLRLGEECPVLAAGDRYAVQTGDDWRSFLVTRRTVVDLGGELVSILTGDIWGPTGRVKISGFTHDSSHAEALLALGFRHSDQVAALGHLARDI